MPSSTSPTGHSCPFAAALDAEDDASCVSGSASPVPFDDVKRCPAFQESSCPFKDAKSPEEIRKTLAKVPPSHYDSQGKFFRVIRDLHSVRVEDEAFMLQGGCPVQQAHADSNVNELRSFHDAMEDFSFAAVMASLAKQEEAKEEEQSLPAASSVLPSASTPASFEPRATSTTKATTTSLSQSLKTGTAASHQAAEDVHFVANFIKGNIDRKLYAQLVHMLYHVYAALEDCLDEHAQRHFPSCHFPNELRRVPSLEQDLDFWYGKRLPQQMTPATRDYVERIQYIAQNDPLLLLAHSYTRYLGDLSGGKILARVAKRAMNLGGTSDPVDGLAFYHFENVSSPKKFKDEYRSLLDALPLNQAQIDKLVAEANVAFYLNVRLFEELDVMANVKGAKVRPLKEALLFADNSLTSSIAHGSGSDKCPFADMAQQALKAKPTSAVQICPWPFILMHDPAQGCRDWKTWAVAGLAFCWLWSKIK